MPAGLVRPWPARAGRNEKGRPADRPRGRLVTDFVRAPTTRRPTPMRACPATPFSRTPVSGLSSEPRKMHTHDPPPLPLLASVWLRPGVTIERIVARGPSRYVLPLVLAETAGYVTSEWLQAGLTTRPVDWGAIAILTLPVAIMVVIGLFISGWAFLWVGRLLGGLHLRRTCGRDRVGLGALDRRLCDWVHCLLGSEGGGQRRVGVGISAADDCPMGCPDPLRHLDYRGERHHARPRHAVQARAHARECAARLARRPSSCWSSWPR